MARLLSVPACNLAEFVSRLSAALMNVHDLPAAIRPRSRSFSSDVHRILGTTQSFLRLFAPSIAFRLREFPSIIAGISQCSSRPLTGQGDRLIERAFPGHDATPRQNRDSNRGGRIRSVQHPSLPLACPQDWASAVARVLTRLPTPNRICGAPGVPMSPICAISKQCRNVLISGRDGRVAQ